MNRRLLGCAFFLVVPLAAEALPAFLGADGAGATSVGGRGGVICEVTNLNNSGTGSLRACIDMSGPRIVVFRVGGIIELAGGLAVKNPYITIAGQTAPGGGITISGRNSKNVVLSIRTHDVTMRYLRFRKGYNASTPYNDGDAANVTNVSAAVSNVIYDHCSMSWTQDENGEVWGDSLVNEQPKNVTYSWSIFAEPLIQHSKNFITGANSNKSDTMVNIDIHHSLFANSSERSPLIKNKTFRFVNNIVYNWSRFATQLGGGVSADVIGNLYKAGPLNGTYSATIAPKSSVYEIQVFTTPNDSTPLGQPSLYIVGNMGPYNPNPTNDNWAMVREISSENGSELRPLSAQYRRSVPLPALTVPIMTHPVNQLESVILPTVGASQRLDCLANWVSVRDAVDGRIIQEYHTNRGIIPTTENDVGGFPAITSGTPCADTDHDGMPDAWEDANGLNKNNPADGPLAGPDGYTNIERYLNGSKNQSLLSVPQNVRLIQP